MAESRLDGRPTAFDVDRYNNLAALSRLIHEYMTVDPQPTGSGLLAWVETLDGGDVIGGDDAVDLVTFHGAKGLEWSVVHVAGLENGFVPIAYAATPTQLAEEQRLVYVALTRAQDQLRLSWCRERTFGTKSMVRTPSPLIEVLHRAMKALGGTGPVETDWRGHIRRSRRAIEGRVTLGSIGDGSKHSLDDAEAEQLYQSLRSWRDRKAKAGGVPPHVIVSDQVLRTVARHRPATTAQLAAVTDLRPAKLARLGPDLLAQIAAATAGAES